MQLMMPRLLMVLVSLFFFGCSAAQHQSPTRLQVLIVDGANNHSIWPKTTQMIKDYLEESGLFEVTVARLDTVWLGYSNSPNHLNAYPQRTTPPQILEKPQKTAQFSIDFSPYDLVVSNMGNNAPYWPAATMKSFEAYMANGGGLVVVHAADNSWGQWEGFNKMIGLGAWGGRDSTSGPFVHYVENKGPTADHNGRICGTHGKQHEYIVTTRDTEHPIMKGLPENWLHAKDELYDRMRGPFENATILATAFSDAKINAPRPDLPGTGKHVPALMAVEYGKGRTFHTILGHADYSMECVGFITTLLRGAEWAATGKVTQPVPADFPKAGQLSSRKWSGHTQK